MPLSSKVREIPEFYFQKPMRAIFSGSSQSGKTHLISKIISEQNQLFGESFKQVRYFYPSYLDESPVEFFSRDYTIISYDCGFPTKDDVLSMEENSLLIIDDQADIAVKSDLIAQLFKVISGKKNISVILVTQNYYIQGKHSRDIRNSCNYVGLFRNCCDRKLNKRVARDFGLLGACEAAENDVFTTKIHPYIFIDQTQIAQLCDYRLYVKILGNYRVAYNNEGMKGYIVQEKDFKKNFKIIDRKKFTVTAISKNEDSKKKLQPKRKNSKSDREKN